MCVVMIEMKTSYYRKLKSEAETEAWWWLTEETECNLAGNKLSWVSRAEFKKQYYKKSILALLFRLNE